MPAVASHAGAAALNGKIYVVGGFVANVHVGAMNRVFEYDPAADRWRALAPLAAPRGSPGVVAVNGKIHAIGGRDAERKTVTTHEIYDPATNTWSMAAPLPGARDHLGIAVAAGRIHVFGGRTDATVDNTARHDVYDPATNTWSTAAPLMTARSAGATFALDGRIVYAGGECKDAGASVTFTEVEAYRSADEPVDDVATAAARPTRGGSSGRRRAGLSPWRQYGLWRHETVEGNTGLSHAVTVYMCESCHRNSHRCSRCASVERDCR